MPLVAYASSGESDSDDEQQLNGRTTQDAQPSAGVADGRAAALKKGKLPSKSPSPLAIQEDSFDGPVANLDTAFSDDEDDRPTDVPTFQTNLQLPAPKTVLYTGQRSTAVLSLGLNGSVLTNDESVEALNDISDLGNIGILHGLPAASHSVSDQAKPLPVIAEGELEDFVKILPTELAMAAETKPLKRQPVKITLPAMPASDSDSDDDLAPKLKKHKPATSKGTVGLFSLLPPPKSGSIKEIGRPLIPHAVAKQPLKPPVSIATSSAATSSPAVAKKTTGPMIPHVISKQQQKAVTAKSDTGITNSEFTPKTVSSSYQSDDDDDDNDAAAVNFFSIGTETQKSDVKASEITESDVTVSGIPETSDPRGSQVFTELDPRLADAPLQFSSALLAEGGSWRSGMVGPSRPVVGNDTSVDEPAFSDEDEPTRTETAEFAGEPSENPEMDASMDNPEKLLGDEQFRRLFGGKKRKSSREEIEIIDVRVDDYFGSNASIELTKHITEELDMPSHSKKNAKDLPTSQQKRKHQIHFLAHQAKEREFELKNQWADNKFTKKQTQSKYGF